MVAHNENKPAKLIVLGHLFVKPGDKVFQTSAVRDIAVKQPKGTLASIFRYDNTPSSLFYYPSTPPLVIPVADTGIHDAALVTNIEKIYQVRKKSKRSPGRWLIIYMYLKYRRFYPQR